MNSPAALFFFSRRPADEKGLILIAGIFMVLALASIIVICVYPLAHEAKNEINHYITLQRLKEVERGAFGRLANQRGGKFNACGGYFSDTGLKVRVNESTNDTEIGKFSEYWSFRDYFKLYKWSKDLYRYDKDLGFWAGYRGKRYIVRPPGEEHRRTKIPQNLEMRYTLPVFFDGFKNKINFGGTCGVDFPFLKTHGKHYDIRYYNPVEKLIININDHRNEKIDNLSVKLICARQPTYRAQPKVEQKIGFWEDSKFDHTFIFDWATECKGHTFEIGLKKLIIYEDNIPKFTQAICIPPTKKFYDREQIYRNSYTVEIDYDG